MVNLLKLEQDERVTSILPVKEFSEDKFIVMATANGTIKKVTLTAFEKPRSSGLRAIDLVEGDRLVETRITNGKQDILLLSSAGKAMRF